ncbi:MAG: helix-turn-helix transcriptional regulator, partial [Flavobacteriales bacterium]|nr:helix-turn-helix transcriptional regulator [Flavobacteriales bacterium]
MSNKIYIKNMVCPRCISTVGEIFNTQNIKVNAIQLGEVSTSVKINELQKSKLKSSLLKNGFELLEDNKSKLIGQIKSIIVDQIHHQSENLKVNFSTLLAENLHHEYTSLSKLFSSVEGVTIERFILKQKVEKVKELLFYNQLSLSEIAFQMNYSSVAHLSSQFKKETGMTPSKFKKIRKPSHKS